MSDLEPRPADPRPADSRSIAPADLTARLRAALDAPGSRYRLLSQALDQMLADQDLRPGDFLPPERDLAADLGVSRSTVRKALEPLLHRGKLEQRVGAGTSVAREPQAPRLHRALNQLTSFTEDIRMRGMVPSSLWLRQTLVTADPHLAVLLGASPLSNISLFERVRLADDQPMAHEKSYFPAHLIDASQVKPVESVYAALDASQSRPVRAIQNFQAVGCPADAAEHLHVRPGEAVLKIERHGFGRHGEPVEFTQSLYRGDLYVFALELQDAAP